MRHRESAEHVRRYYDRNTRKFLRSRIAAPQSIHQPLYASPSSSLSEALHTQHKCILESLPSVKEECTILDLGCGVGESMIYLAKHTSDNYKYIGVTLSGEQAVIARTYVADQGLENRVQVIEGDFHALQGLVPAVNLAYAIESLIHSPKTSEFFAQVASVLQPGSKLIVIDDVLQNRIHNKREQKILEALRTGWLALTLMTPEELSGIAKKHGLALQAEKDFSSMLKFGLFRDHIIRLFVPLARLFLHQSQYCRFMVGGDARQRAYEYKLLKYVMLTFVKMV